MPRRVDGIPMSVVTLSLIGVKSSRVKACKCLEAVRDKIDSRTLISFMWGWIVGTGANSGIDIWVYQPYCVDAMHLQENISSANGKRQNLEFIWCRLAKCTV